MQKIKNEMGGVVKLPLKDVLLKSRESIDITDEDLAALRKGFPDIMKQMRVFDTGRKKEAVKKETASGQPKTVVKKTGKGTKETTENSD